MDASLVHRNIDVPPPPQWIELPWDVTADILQRLGSEGMLTSAQQVCTTWWKVCKDPSLWRVIDFSDKKQSPHLNKYTVMCRCAVDRSQGQLVDLTIQYFGGDTLLEYITERSSNLKRLKLRTCFNITGDVATRMFSKLYHRNLYAFAISKSMPNLHHLQLFAHWIGNEGLEAILRGCPRLESLDIRRCFDLDLEGDLGKRCRQKLNILNSPITLSVIYRGLIAMAEIHLILLPPDLNFTNTTIIKIMMF
ncbi:putative F-box/LRR-repeat protein 23 [Salvia splendens]|uniref:putative F-box/LRR-repeat protein 23 n=1 Tax=Salvia splendens TaxID=180675 RepID=UPI001C27D180|nr:putative F-box/LRR-repeat protein 23 [Salvia splendens]